MKRPLSMVCLLAVCLLFFETTMISKTPPEYLSWEGQQITVTGEVYRKEKAIGQNTDRQIVYLRLYSLQNERERAVVEEESRVICYLNTNQKMPEMGSVIRATGKMKCFEKATNPGQFDAESYYQVLHISFQLNQTEIQAKSTTYNKWQETLYKVKCAFSDILDKTLPQKDASIMKTMLLGDKRVADAERKELYQRNGIAHIQAISGLHISILGMSLYRVLRKIGVPMALCTGIPTLFMIGYGYLTGFSVSVIRAVGMFVVHMIAVMCRRTYDMVTATAVLAVIILIEQPMYLYNSSFLLSFGCVLGIGLLVPALTKKQQKKEKEPSGFMLKIMSGSCVSLTILPLQLAFFYQVPGYSVFLNLFVIPLMNYLLPLGVLLLLCGGLEIFIQNPIAFSIEVILNCYDLACEFCEKLPASLVTLGQPDKWRVVLYVTILVLIVVFQKKLLLRQKWILVLAAILILLWPLPKETCITFLDVGQGDCIHIQSRNGNHYLIDGGSSNVSKVGEYRILPYLKYVGVSELEAVFVTHPDEDHCNGILELLALAEEEGIMIRHLYLPDIEESAKKEAYYELAQAAEDASVDVSYFSKGMCLQDGELSLQCLHPYRGYEAENENAYSLVFLMQYKEFEVLLTGDVEQEGERELLAALQEASISDIEVLKVAHHGSRNSTTEEFLGQVSPEVAVISCSENNSYGHPHEETMKRLFECGTDVLTTPECGAITVEVGKEKGIVIQRWK